jgi:perosamine synthetase
MSQAFIPNCIPSVEGRGQAYAAEAISGGWLAAGPFIERFEKAIASFTGAAHAVALMNGTAALHLALELAGVRANDLVIAPTLTFAATVHAIKYCGADPVFIDSEPASWGIDPALVARFLDQQCATVDGQLVERRTGRRIGALLPVHLYGHPVDLEPLVALSNWYGIPLVEDGAEALGARYKGRMVGSLHHLCVLSFNGNKIITGGAGGMILTDNEATAHRARYLSAQAKLDPSEFVHGDVGYNYRLPNLNAAVLLGQAEMLPEFLARKRSIMKRYASALTGINGVSMWQEATWAESSYWMSMLTVDPAFHPDAIPELRRLLPSRGIEARPAWLPIHGQKPFADCMHGDIVVAEKIYRNSLCLPCSVGLTDEQHRFVTDTLHEFFSGA